MGYTVGDTITFYEEILSAPDTPVPFPNPVAISQHVPLGSSVSPVYTTETGRVIGVFTPDVVGQYHFVFEETNSGYFYQNTFDVDPIPDFDPGYAVQYLAPSGGRSLGDLRREVAQKLGDYRMVTATNGSTNTIEDLDELYENTNYFRGAQVLFLSGSNAGKTRRIVDSSTASSTLTFAPALTVPIVAGDVAEIYNVGLQGGRVQEYHQAINNALRDAYPQHRVPVKQRVANADLNENRVTIPLVFGWISQVIINYPSGDYVMEGVRYNDALNGWWIDRATREVVINGFDATAIQDNDVTLVGYGRERELTQENDLTTCDVEWVVETAKSYRLLGKLDQTLMSAGQAFGNRADQLRGKMAVVPIPGTIEI